MSDNEHMSGNDPVITVEELKAAMEAQKVAKANPEQRREVPIMVRHAEAMERQAEALERLADSQEKLVRLLASLNYHGSILTTVRR